MPSFPESTPTSQIRWQVFSCFCCIGFAFLLVLLTHPLGDGGWYWYSILFRQGRRIYTDLHLPLQPMLVLEMASFQRIFGISWIASLFIGMANACIYLTAIFLVLRHIPWKDWQKAILLFCVFTTTTDFLTFRFDDYHILSSCFALYSLALLIATWRSQATRQILLCAAGLGIVSGLCITNRLNDGAALLASVLFVAFLLQPRYRTYGTATTLMAAGATSLAVIMATHETFSSWRQYTIIEAAKIKGGTGHVLAYPLDLPIRTLHLLAEKQTFLFCLLTIATCALGVLTLKFARSADGRLDKRRIVGALAVFSLVCMTIRHHLHAGAEARSVAYLAVLAMFALSAWALYRAIRAVLHPGEAAPSSSLALLILIPFGQLCSIAMSSGVWYPNAFPPAAAFLLILPIAFPEIVSRTWQRTTVLIAVILLGVAAAQEKMTNPFHWWDYHSASISSSHVWHHHPIYGAMYIESEQLNFITPVCQQIEAGKATGSDLLSLPYPYANYFCGIPPWREYVQTFFDTSSQATIDSMIAGLEKQPPKWIVYQRQMEALRSHEISFHGGKPLPHRALDELIVHKVTSGAWQVTYQRHLANEKSDWYLIRTHP